jgi:putative alpha-1,2-mannosidase
VIDRVTSSLIGNAGPEPNLSGGMIPSTAPPFGMTRWVAQTRQNYVSTTPYNYSDTTIHGFQGTHQPAIWMGESAQVVVVPGMGQSIKSLFEERGMEFLHENEAISPSYYSVQLRHPTSGMIFAEQSAS